MLKKILKKRLIKRMRAEYDKTDDIDYSDCGNPVGHLERDLYLTYLELLGDDKLRRWSLLSVEDYNTVVKEYYEEVEGEFEGVYY